MPKIQIFRRAFNAEEGKPNPKQLVATFPSGMEEEAEFLLEKLRTVSASFQQPNARFANYRYNSVELHPPVASASEEKGIQVDVSNAKRTPRPISYQLSWEIKHGECHCLAWHHLYGSIRGTVEDSPQGRRLFVNRITAVWPNADIVAH